MKSWYGRSTRNPTVMIAILSVLTAVLAGCQLPDVKTAAVNPYDLSAKRGPQLPPATALASKGPRNFNFFSPPTSLASNQGQKTISSLGQALKQKLAKVQNPIQGMSISDSIAGWVKRGQASIALAKTKLFNPQDRMIEQDWMVHEYSPAQQMASVLKPPQQHRNYSIAANDMLPESGHSNISTERIASVATQSPQNDDSLGTKLASFSLPFSKNRKAGQQSKSMTARNDTSRRIRAARELELRGSHDQAIREYELVLQVNRYNPFVLHRLAVLYDRRGDLQRSHHYYDTALQLDPGNVELLCDAGYHCSLSGDAAAAADFYRRALRESPRHERTHSNYAILLAQHQMTDVAYQHFVRAGLSPDDAQNNIAIVAESSRLLR